MKKRFTEAQIVFALRQAASGTAVAEIIRKMGISEPTFYRWKKLYAGMGGGQYVIRNWRSSCLFRVPVDFQILREPEVVTR